MAIKVSECSWTDTSKMQGFKIVVLPWGSCEPHGEHLPYGTDTMLAEKITIDAIRKTKKPSLFNVLPPIPYGLQNRGQFDKKFCIHMSATTQESIIIDIAKSMQKQFMQKLVIVNGHNGNDFKAMVRDIEEKTDIDLYVCNYLDIADREFMKSINGAPEIDDHAGFTETSLMMYFFPGLVHMENLDSNEIEWFPKRDSAALWTPRDWDKASFNTRVGDPRDASAWAGELIATHVVDMLSKDLDKILKFEI